MSNEELKPCPFCGDIPSLDDDGSCIEITCCTSMSLQKCDYLTIEERKTWNSWTYNYDKSSEDKAMRLAIKKWNTRPSNSEGFEEVWDKYTNLPVEERENLVIAKSLTFKNQVKYFYQAGQQSKVPEHMIAEDHEVEGTHCGCIYHGYSGELLQECLAHKNLREKAGQQASQWVSVEAGCEVDHDGNIKLSKTLASKVIGSRCGKAADLWNKIFPEYNMMPKLPSEGEG